MHFQSSQIIPFEHSQTRVQSIDVCQVLQAQCMAAILLNERCLVLFSDLFDFVSEINILKSLILQLETEQSLLWL